MPKRKKRENFQEQLQEKAVGAVIIGFVLLFIPLFGGALRSLAWILILLGIVLLALPVLIEQLRKANHGSDAEPNAWHQAPPPANPFSSGGKRYWSQTRKPVHDIKFGRTSSVEKIEPVFEVAETVPHQVTAWGPDVFAAIEWRRFEAVCEALFAQAGFATTSQSHGADGGVDIWLYSKNAQGPAAIVQCKHWNNKAVGVRELREFFGVMASHKLTRGTYATTSTFTQDALLFAKANGINAMDGSRLLKQIATRTPEQQRQLLEVAYEGEYWRPTCASCGIKLLERTGRSRPFWGCSNFPKCKTQIWRKVG